MYNKLTVEDVDVKGKKVLVRCDFNVPLDADGTLYEGRGQKAWLSEQSEYPLLSLNLVTFATDGADE